MRSFMVLLAMVGTSVSAFAVPLPDVVDRVAESVFELRVITPTNWGNKETGGTAVHVGKGYFITALHVVDGASKIRLLVDKEQLPMKVVDRSFENDLVLVKADYAGTRAPLVPETDVRYRVGMGVLVMGHPFGYDLSVTSGILSGLLRKIPMKDRERVVLQTDAAINPGNSGGPLVTREGKWIGIVVAVREAACGIGFAVPIEPVAKLMAANGL